ncbi:hypothetical protein J2800_000725 [Caulobacter rhizosphaerae]|jgi:hypothetical protein|uniref:Uncharacterized protein n=1 Tax=Caulobacter rhizosphaerae TaxID=2010972 RepID=A0ABU1MV27_9CAUL|nr:hypothetical protein [Caulobacter rhizosphaerae]MDR6530001.1 hypothetical protein [Caulobacter rhizosphaerae]
MTRIWTIVTVLVLAAIPAAAQAGWAATEWDMTPAQVEAAMPQTKPLKHGEALSMGQAKSVGSYPFGGQSVRAVYYYDDRGLSLVTLTVPFKACGAALEQLQRDHGQPLKISDQVLFRLAIWHDEPMQTRICAMISPEAKICALNFERLSTYREHDLAPAARP